MKDHLSLKPPFPQNLKVVLKLYTLYCFRAGGIIPKVARKYHQKIIGEVVNTALKQSGRSLEEVGGVAVTVCPGMISCLDVGISHARELALSVG